MKPIHVGLLMITAALGGGLLVKWQASRPAPVPVMEEAAPAPSAPPAPPAPPVPIAAEQAPVKPVPPARKPRAMQPAPAEKRAAPVEVVSQNVPPPSQPAAAEPVAAEPPAPIVQQVAPEPRPPAAPPAPPQNIEPAAPPPPAQVTLTAGTVITVRTIEALSTARNQTGDTFTATLDQPLVVDGFVIAERGAHLEGRVVSAERAGKVSGLSGLSLELVQLRTSDGQHVAIETQPYVKRGETSKGQDAAQIGAVAAIGAAIGAIAGGGKGAAIGAGAGGAAGAGTVMATRGKDAVLPPETRISFHLRNSLTLTERRQARQ